MRKLTKIILPEVEVGDLKIRPRGDNRCESANCSATIRQGFPHDIMASQLDDGAVAGAME